MAGGPISSALAYDPGAADIVAVSSRASPEYVRVREKDGTYAPETYCFGKGGDWAGTFKDDSIDKLTFTEVAHVIAYPLADQRYIPGTDPDKTKLLIMVYWGTTHAPLPANEAPEFAVLKQAFDASSKAVGWTPISTARRGRLLEGAVDLMEAANLRREKDDFLNIRMLGYDSWVERTREDTRGTAFEQDRQDLYDEIEQNRYFVVLMAYDFQLMRNEKKHRLIWETRFSIRQQHHLFDKDLPSMAAYASRYFGQDSHGLVHDKVPIGEVEVGEVKTLGEAAPTQK